VLQNNPQPYEHAAVSFDPRMIAVARYLRGGTGPTGVWIIDMTELRVAPTCSRAGNGERGLAPSGLSTSGRQRVGVGDGIFRVRQDGSGLTPLLSLDASDGAFLGDVSVSDDGSMLAYVRAVRVPKGPRSVLKTQIWVARADDPRMVDEGVPDIGYYGGFPIGDFDPELSPDNRNVVFTRTNPRFVNFKNSVNTAHDLWIAPLGPLPPGAAYHRPRPGQYHSRLARRPDPLPSRRR